MRRLPRLLLIALASLELLYLVVANVGALVAPRLASQDPDRTELRFHAFSPFPGLIYVWDFHLRAQDRYTQWQLEVDKATLWADFRALKDRVFHVRKIHADGVAFRLRRKLQLKEVTAETIKAQPEIPGFGRIPLRRDQDYQMPPPRPDTWSIKMENVTASARELWVDTLRYQGKLEASGAWRLKLENEAQIGPAHVELHGGSLLRDGKQLARNLEGKVDGTLDTFPALDLTMAKVLDRTHVTMTLKGGAADENTVLPLLPVSKQLAPHYEDATFAVNATLEKGVPQPSAKMMADVRAASVSLGKLWAQGSLHADAEVKKNGRVYLTALGDGLRILPHGGKKAYAEHGRVRITSSAPVQRADQVPQPSVAHVAITGARLADASMLNELIPDPVGLTVSGGRVTLGANLRVNMKRGVASGRLRADAKGLKLRYAGGDYEGGIGAQLKVAGLRTDGRAFSISGSRVDIRDVHAPKAERVLPWSAAIEIPSGSVALGRKEVFRGGVKASVSNGRPLFAALLAGAKMPGLVKKLATPNRVSVTAELGLGHGRVRVDALEGVVGQTNVRATARLAQNEVDLAGVLSMGVLKAGIVEDNGKRHIHLFPGHKWYPDRVAEITGG